jgi:hypothetical protein
MPAKTKALLSLEENLERLGHMLSLTKHEATMLAAQAKRLSASVIPDVRSKPELSKLLRRLNRFTESLTKRSERLQTLHQWQIVMLVTCTETYLQDLLAEAAKIEPELMRNSQQLASYADIVGATSLELLADGMRSRWARNWLADGGPTRWISRLEKMGARNYPTNLSRELERFWSIRHLVVHSAGVVTPEFRKKHPELGKAWPVQINVTHHYIKKFVEEIGKFLEPTEAYFIKRFPLMAAESKSK